MTSKEALERLEQLENENKELKEELKRCQETIESWCHNHKKLIIDNGKMKKAIKILKEHINISFYDEDCQIYIYEDEYCADFSCLLGFGKDEIDEYMLLKEVFESDR